MAERFDKGVVVLPSYCKPDPADLPENMPPIEVCCVPVALVSTTTELEPEVLRWVDLSDLHRVL